MEREESGQSVLPAAQRASPTPEMPKGKASLALLQKGCTERREERKEERMPTALSFNNSPMTYWDNCRIKPSWAGNTWNLF